MMKQKILITAVTLLFSWLSVDAQGILEANKFSQTDLRGTARSMSMGGAFGALGGDISAISINPAGIGVYKSSEIVATLDFQNVENKATSSYNTMTDKKFNVNFNNFGFVGTFPVYSDVAPLVNFGFSYNKVKSFNKKYQMQGSGAQNGTLADYIAARANRGINGKPYTPEDLNLGGLNQTQADNKWRYDDWLPLLGYNGFLISPSNNNGFVSSMSGLNFHPENDLFVEEKGSINKYDFNVGTTFADMISAGLTVSVTDIDYRMSSGYIENYYTEDAMFGGYTLENKLKTEGTGWQLGLGVIFKPVQELRIGVAYHSPTWYNMTDIYYADLYYDFNEDLVANNPDFDGYNPNAEDNSVKSMDGYSDSRTEYKLRTPDKWTFSIAGVLGKNAIISLDYELVDYKKAKFQDRDGRDLVDVNKGPADGYGIEDAYKLTSTLRVGGEYRITPQFSARIGYSWQESPYSDAFKKFINPQINKETYFDTPGSVTQYVIEKDTHYITWGLGYRFTRNFYTDVAFVYRAQKGDLYTHSMSDVTKLKENSMQASLTCGFRF